MLSLNGGGIGNVYHRHMRMPVAERFVAAFASALIGAVFACVMMATFANAVNPRVVLTAASVTATLGLAFGYRFFGLLLYLFLNGI